MSRVEPRPHLTPRQLPTGVTYYVSSSDNTIASRNRNHNRNGTSTLHIHHPSRKYNCQTASLDGRLE